MNNKTKLGFAGIGLLGNLASFAIATPTYAQDSSLTQDNARQKNWIYSRCPEYSATGEGIFLKDFILNETGSEKKLGEILNCLYTEKGDISYDSIGARRGLESALNYLREGPLTDEKRASINYIQGLLQKVSDEENYVIIGMSSAPEGYTPQSVMVLVNSSKQPNQIQQPDTVETREEPQIPEEDRTQEIRPISRITTNEFELLIPYDSLTLSQREHYNQRLTEFMQGRNVREISPGHYVIVPTEEHINQVSRETSPRTIKGRTLDFTLESEFNLGNRELTAGASLGIWPCNQLRLAGFGNASLYNEEPFQTENSTDTVRNETQLIGPGTYKTVTNTLTTNTESKGNLEFGVEVSAKPWKFLELFTRFGTKKMKITGEEQGESKISFERNQESLGNPATISNTRLLNDSYNTYPSLSAGVRLDMGGLLLDTYFKRINEKNQGGIRAGFRF